MAITRVSKVGTNNSAVASTTIAVTVPVAGVSAGNHLIVGTGCSGTTITLSSVTDSKSNTYQVDRQHAGTTAGRNAHIASGKIGTALVSGDTITATFSASIAQQFIGVYEYSGLATSAWLDQVNSADGNSTLPNSGNVTTTQADELLFGCCKFGNISGYAPDAPWTELDDFNNGTQGEETMERIVSATETQAASGTITTGAWASCIATYKAAAGGAVFIPRPELVRLQAVNRAASY